MSDIKTNAPLAVTRDLTNTQLITREDWQDAIPERSLPASIGSISLWNMREPLTIDKTDDVAHAYNAVFDALHNDPEAHKDLLSHIRSLEESASDADKPVFNENPFLADPLSAPEIVDNQPRVLADPKVLEFIEDRDMSGAQTHLTETLSELLPRYVSGLENGVREGYISAQLLDKLPAALGKTNVRIVDGALLGVDRHTHAYYDPHTHEMGMRHDLSDDKDPIVVLAHEMTHNMSGGTFVSSGRDGDTPVRSRMGFSSETAEGHRGKSGIDEATDHHITLSILSGDFETIDPDKRADGDTGYYANRKTVATFIENSQGVISVKTWTKAHGEDSGPGGSLTDRKELVRQTVGAYGYGALRKLETLCKISGNVAPEQLSREVLSRIHAPTLNEQGVVTTKGYIDTDNLPDF